MQTITLGIHVSFRECRCDEPPFLKGPWTENQKNTRAKARRKGFGHCTAAIEILPRGWKNMAKLFIFLGGKKGQETSCDFLENSGKHHQETSCMQTWTSMGILVSDATKKERKSRHMFGKARMYVINLIDTLRLDTL